MRDKASWRRDGSIKGMRESELEEEKKEE